MSDQELPMPMIDMDMDETANVEVTLTTDRVLTVDDIDDGEDAPMTWARPVNDGTGFGAISVVAALQGAIEHWAMHPRGGGPAARYELQPGDKITISVFR